MLPGPKVQIIDGLYACICTHVLSICFTQMSMFSIHFLFLYLLLQKKGRFLSILYTSVYDILYQVFLLYALSLFQKYVC